MSRHTFLVLALAALPVLAGCGKTEDDAPAGPAPVDDAGVGNDATPIRKVEKRNPFGKTQVSDNLLADGDFEITGRTGQPPWYAFDGGGQSVLNYETGGRCYSGVRCAALTSGQMLLGFIASPKTGGMNVSIMVKPASKNCADATVSVTDLSNSGRTVTINHETDSPDDSGWCRFSGSAPNYARESPVLHVETTGDVLVDDGEVLPAAGGTIIPLSADLPPRAETIAHIDAAAAWIREHRIYGRAPAALPEGPSRHLRDRVENVRDKE